MFNDLFMTFIIPYFNVYLFSFLLSTHIFGVFFSNQIELESFNVILKKVKQKQFLRYDAFSCQHHKLCYIHSEIVCAAMFLINGDILMYLLN